MKRTCAIFLLFLGTAAATFAQAPTVSIAVTSNQDHPVIEISNSDKLPIEAFLITVDIAQNGARLTRIYYDSHVYSKHDVPIPSGGSHQVPLPHIVGGPEPEATLRAVVFSDGSSTGDQEWVNELISRRASLAEALKEVLSLLATISEQNLTKDEAIALLQRSREARKSASAHTTPETRLLQDLPFVDAISNLDPPVKADREPPAFQVRVKKTSQFLEDWLADLQSAKPAATTSVDPAN